MRPPPKPLKGGPKAERVRAAVSRAGREQTDIASSAGLSWPQWQRRMRGSVDWRLDELRRIARALDIPLTDLTGNGDQP